ncbi:MAG: hypothetical protein V1753_03910 [Pseudomonadota bacterium]
MFKTNPFSRSTYDTNKKIIGALGAIGDPRAIPTLTKLAQTFWTFHPVMLVDMKLAIFKSLSEYPRDSIKELLKIGSLSRNIHIKRLCDNLIPQSR